MNYNSLFKTKSILLEKSQKNFLGFTLVELLLAIIMGSLVISFSGLGLMAMIRVNQDSEAKITSQVELNRAINYISEDIRMANKIEAVPSGSNLPAGATGVFMLTIADNPSYNLVYFIKASPANWYSPYTIYRAKADYSGGVNISLDDNEVNELVDAIALPGSEPTCDSGTLEGANGFYACLESDYQTVELHLFRQLINSSKEDPMSAQSIVVTRGNQ